MKLRICLSFETENNSISGTLQLAFLRLSNKRLITERWLGCLKIGLVIKIYTVRHACMFSFVNNTPLTLCTNTTMCNINIYKVWKTLWVRFFILSNKNRIKFDKCSLNLQTIFLPSSIFSRFERYMILSLELTTPQFEINVLLFV